jgi:adenylosuccinate lyase
MEARNIFLNLSPLDHRYYLSNRALFDRLSSYISEEASIRFCVKAEAALMKAHLFARKMLTQDREKAIDALAAKIDPSEVYAEEEKTKHNIRALVNVMKKKLDAELSPFVHLGATSVDILDTAAALKLKAVTREVILPLLCDLVTKLCEISQREADTPQVGRTHGQHAVPITFGFALSEYVSRIGKSVLKAEALTRDLRGKLSGAVGSYNALSMSYPDPEAIERDYLSRLGLEPSEHSTQLVEPEHALRLLLELNVAFGAIANLADDLRNLQRTEIDEVRESFGSEQVGSSTMPQKRNPWNSEHVKSLWKAFAPRAMTFFMDQISEHQRDLTNSASERFVADYLAGFVAAVNRMISVLSSLSVNRERMLSNLRSTGGAVLAEPAYILLSEAGDTEAHETVRKLTLEAERSGKPFNQVIAESKELLPMLRERLAAIGAPGPEAFFSSPESYRGKAAKKARELSGKYGEAMESLKKDLGAGARAGA